MNKTYIRYASRWLGVAAVALLMGQSVAMASDGGPQKHRIAGVWNVRVNITNCEPGNVPGSIVFASFDAMGLFTADGAFFDANAQNPATQSTHLGYWRHVRGNKYEFAQKLFLFDLTGASIGWRIVRHDVVLSRNGFGYTSKGAAETYDTQGLLLSTGCSTSSAIRFD